ncbi:hypothetical protein [Dongia deserti]|uniref:hypothetical protein n=1 Tax=Dongia deserti TaxID=2268030 RepID=UPI000E65A3A2|nr:hypothetical protein [Dongia deserti]
MSAQDSAKQTDRQAVAEHVAAAVTTPLARLVPSASAVPDPSIDAWVEREQRRGRSSIKVGLTILGVACLAGIAMWVLSRPHALPLLS